MVRIETNSNFEKERKKFIKNNLQLAEKVIKAINLLTENPRHPGLNLEILEPREFKIYSFRIDKKYRAIFIYIAPQIIEIIDVNNHYQ